LLTRDWGSTSNRTGSDKIISTSYTPDDRSIVEAVARLAEQLGVPRAQLAMAWVLRNPVITAPLVGVTKTQHIDDAVAALTLSLTDDDVAALEEPYTPRTIVGFS
jgi:aryl-alcohol dehydrogenase (NADP+)